MSRVLAFASSPSLVPPRRRWTDRDTEFAAAIRDLRILQRTRPLYYKEVLDVLRLGAHPRRSKKR